MRPVYFSFTNPQVGNVAGPIVLDQYIAPGNATCTISSIGGTSSTCILEYTTDNVIDYPAPSNIVWQPYTASPFSATGSYSFTGTGTVEAMFSYAPKALRVRVTAVAGNPTINIQVIQAGLGGT